MRWFFFILLVEYSVTAFLLPTTTIYSHHSSLLQSPSSLHSSLLQSSSSLSPEWTEQNGSFFLRPIASTTPPTTCINFLGGALFGASPSLFYGPFLKTLASPPYNYLVVATPCVLTFDHLNTAEQIHTSLEIVRNDVETEYPGLRFCNVGHSFGSLMHVLIETLFRSDVDGNTTNVLIAFNNRNILESVPGFEEVFVPLLTTLSRRRVLSGLDVGFEIAGSVARGERVDEDLIEEAIDIVRKEFVGLGLGMGMGKKPRIPNFQLPPLPPSPLLAELLVFLSQLPPLFDDVGGPESIRDFKPSPESVSKLVSMFYKTKNTLIVKFDEDESIDESDKIERLLKGREVCESEKVVVKGKHLEPVDFGLGLVPDSTNVNVLAIAKVIHEYLEITKISCIA